MKLKTLVLVLPLFAQLLLLLTMRSVYAEDDTVDVYNIISVTDLGPPAHDIQVVVEVQYCPDCNPNPAGNPGCPPFTHGYPGPPPYPTTQFWCGGLVDGRDVAVQLRDGAGTVVGGPSKIVCTPVNCPLTVLTQLTFIMTGTGLVAGDDVTAESDVYCSWCGHWYPAPVTIHIQAPQVPVGGEWLPTSKVRLLAPTIGLASLTMAIAASFVFVKRIKRQQN